MGLFGLGKKKEEAVVPPVATEEVQEQAPKVAIPEGHIIVRIFCSAGASTSLWAQNVQKAMDAQGRDMEIQAFSISVIDDEGKDANVILIGPQTRYVEPEVKVKFSDKVVAVVPMQTFGLMNGEKGLEFIDTLL